MRILRVIDFETTGLPPRADIVEVGYTDVFVDRTISTELMWHAELCQPKMKIETEALAVHHITEEDVKGHREPGAVLGEVSADPHVFVAHNAAFERKFFQPKQPWICTMKGAKVYISDSPRFSNQVLRYHCKLDDHPQFDRAMALPPHRAGPDTYVTAFLLMELLKRATIDQLIEVTGKIALLPTIPFGKHKGKEWKDIPPDYITWLRGQGNVQEDVLHSMNHYLGQKDDYR